MSNERTKSQGRPGGGHRGPMGGGPMGGMGMPGAKSKDFKGTILRLMAYMAEFKWQMMVVLIFALASTVFSIVGPKLLGRVTAKLFDGLVAWMGGLGLLTDFVYIRNMILLLVGLYLLSAGFAFVQNYIMAGISMKVTYRLRRDISEKMNRLPLGYYDKLSHGEVLSRITNDVDTVSQTLSQSLSQIVTSAATLLGILVMMLSISWLMTLTALLILPLSVICILFIVRRSQKYFRTQQEYLGHINGHVEETYSGHKVVQAFNREREVVETFEGYNQELYHSAWKAQFLSSTMMPLMNFVSNLGYVAVCILGGYLAVKRTVDVGDIQAFIQYVRTFTQPLAQLANISNVLQSTAAAAERVFEFLSEEEELPDRAEELDRDHVRGDVTFQHIRFGYQPDKPVIHDFSAQVKKGQKVAIVGPTGAGKTTIVKLLMRFYEADGGEILIDGQSTRELTRENLRSMFGMVLQDTWLYNASVLENIRYGNFEKSDAEVVAAAKAAHCDEFIRGLPGGYQMMINEEANNISQGQKQLLTIARTFLADPPILILDEATSSVDTRTEVLVQKAMARLLKNRTSFVIAHRLSTIRDADMILVMRNGDIIEQGNHDDLLAADGFYAELYQSQFSEGEEE